MINRREALLLIPIFLLTAGQRHEAVVFEALLEQGAVKHPGARSAQAAAQAGRRRQGLQQQRDRAVSVPPWDQDDDPSQTE